jgi:arylsulfatase A-like enzyme
VIRVPLIAAWPGQLPAATGTPAIQSLVDLAPTFLSAAGLDVPTDMQGLSQLDAWRRAGSARDHALVEMHHNRGAVHLRTLITDRYKLTVYRSHPEWGELFDLQEDPNERRNRFHDPASLETLNMLYRRLVDADLQREPTFSPRVSAA